jgi:hypothetical protein
LIAALRVHPEVRATVGFVTPESLHRGVGGE